MMRLHVRLGQKLSIVDMDGDAHQLTELSGPAQLRVGGPMMMHRRLALRFPQRGIYRLGTRTVEIPGAMDVKTIGLGDNLRLVVTVA